MVTKKSQDDYKKTALRLPQELHESLHAAASSSGRSYNAEIVARLEESLAKQQAAAGIPTEIAAYLAALQNRSLMLDMRADMLKMRLESIGARVIAITKRTVGVDTSELSDAELERMESEIEELREAETEMDTIRGELKNLQVQRHEVLQHLTSMESAVSKKAAEVEEALAGAAARGLKKPADH